jgi:hypothetical protein
VREETDVRQKMKFLFLMSVVFLASVACVRREKTQLSPQPVAITNGEAELRLAIYAYYMQSDARVYVVDESEEFVRNLRSRTGRSILDLRSGAEGSKLRIVGLHIDGGSAEAGFAATGGNTGSELFSVRLKKKSGRWEIIRWHLDAAS